MVLSSVGFIFYAYTVQRLLASGRSPAIWVSMAALTIWAVVALAAGALLTWSRA
jgi:hypothetical protein